MPIQKLRGLGQQGILTDPDPYDLPLEAFSGGVNVRFRNGKISSAPIFRDVLQPLSLSNPRYLFTAGIGQTNNDLFIGYQSGNVHYYSNGTETDYSIAGYTTSAVEATWTSYTIGEVIYVNRSDRTPWYLLPSAVAFQPLNAPNLTTNAATTTSSAVLNFPANSVPQSVIPGMQVTDNTTSHVIGTVLSTTAATVTLTANSAFAVGSGDVISFANGTLPAAWDPTWSCKILSQCAGAIVALNVTKGATSYPTMVKTSSIVSNGEIPASWDQTTPATLATENILQAMDGPIMDACNIGQDLIIYGEREAWRMHADGSSFVYSYTKLPFAKGVMNANCSVELDGKNYCFGIDDIWVHDGISENSLCDQQVRDFVYGSINISLAPKFFVQYNPRLNEVYFCYISGDQYINYQGVAGCNRSAVLNLTTNSWTFDDLPSVFSFDDGPVSNILTYATVTSTYSAMGGSYQDQEDGGKRITVCVGDNSGNYGLQNTLYAFDVYGPGSVAPYPVDANATAPVYLERTGIDLTQLNENLRDYKQVNSLYPQARVDTSGGNSLQISIGVSDYINSGVPTWSPYQPYDGQSNYKIDYNAAGRWFGVRIKWADYRNFTLTGFDFDIKSEGRR